VLHVRWLGRVPFRDAHAVQSAIHARGRDDHLLLLEHPHVLTLGRRGSPDHILVDPTALGADVVHTDRGGDVTYHGPGQLVGYPIVKLRARGLTIPCYVRALELAIIAALREIGISAHIDEDHVGVWTDRGKIAAIGVAQRHGVTLHGFAVNLQPDLSHFDLINPCGIAERGVTSAAAIAGRHVDVEDFKTRIARSVALELTELHCTAR
jgi:lipoate-protein ligase B